MATGIPAIRFSKEQRQRLRAAGLAGRQIAALEERALPLAKLFLRRPLLATRLRDETLAIYRELREAGNRISLLEMFQRSVTAEREQALQRMCDAAIKTVLTIASNKMVDPNRLPSEGSEAIVMLDNKGQTIGYQILANPQIPPDLLLAIFQTAESGIERQARDRAASPNTVRLIWEAIIENCKGAKKTVPPYPWKELQNPPISESDPLPTSVQVLRPHANSPHESPGRNATVAGCRTWPQGPQATLSCHLITETRAGANPIRLTRAPRSLFAQIVAVCYEAMGRKCSARAIRSFVEQAKARERAQLAAAGITKGAMRGRGRPRNSKRPGDK